MEQEKCTEKIKWNFRLGGYMKNYKATIVFRSGAVRELYVTGKSKEDVGMDIFNSEMARGVSGAFLYDASRVESVYVEPVED